MKLKSLMVITLVVLGCSFALAQAPGSYSFWNSTGTVQYCNYNVITQNSGGVAAGLDNTTSVCGFENNSPIVGFAASTKNDGQPAYGAGIVVGDGIYDASCGCFSGLQWTVWQSAKLSKEKNGRFSGKYGWMGVAGSFGGTYFGDNYGYISAGAPKAEVASQKTTSGKAPQVRK